MIMHQLIKTYFCWNEKKQNKTKNKTRGRKGVSNKKNRERTYSKMCHPRSESWAKKFPLLTHWSSRGSGSTKQHESVAERERKKRAAARASTCERAAVRESVSCGEFLSRLHRLHMQETHHGEQLSCAQLHLPNWERRQHKHTHTLSHTLTHSRTLAQWSPSCTWPAPRCTANFLYFLRCCFSNVECLMRCTAKTNFPQLTFPFLNVIRCIFLVYFAVLFFIFSGFPFCDLMSFRCEVLRRCPCC